MASGSPCALIGPPAGTATAGAALSSRVDGSSPVISHLIAAFDDTTVENLDQGIRLEDYAGGGIKVRFLAVMASATSGSIEFEAAIRRAQAAGDDIDSAHTFDFNASGAVTVSGTAGVPFAVEITFTDGADMDSLADGEYGVLRIRRNTSVSGDATGDCQIMLDSSVIVEA